VPPALLSISSGCACKVAQHSKGGSGTKEWGELVRRKRPFDSVVISGGATSANHHLPHIHHHAHPAAPTP
jgi:hypothetical protein